MAWVITNKEHIPVEIVLYSADTSDKIPELDLIHIAQPGLVTCNKQIICRQINPFNQSTCTEDGSKVSFLKILLDLKADISRQIPYMVGNAFFHKICQKTVIMNFSFYLI